MLRRTFPVVLSGLFLTSTLGFQSVIAQSGSDSTSAEQVRTSVEKIGQGRDAKVEAKLRDGRKVTGYISASSEDSFVITNQKQAVRKRFHMWTH